ncbi:MAG: TonB-dependent receptor [Nitrospiraceae bacterium]
MDATTLGGRFAARARQPLLDYIFLSIFFIVSTLFLCGAAQAANQVPTTNRTDTLADMSLDQLMSLEVTSVAKEAQPLGQAASAVFVITNEDIRRSGATSIPEVLRMAPGIHVARIDAHRWAITARGFNTEYANKLLVLMDGRTLYTPLFSGVFWDVQDTVLEDIDRIEVIRGPGASLWGANAVNGVINIITKKAKDTQGLLMVAGAGTEERGFGTIRYGTSLGDNTHVRAYVKGFERDDYVLPNRANAADGWRQLRTGFRLDSNLGEKDTLSVHGNYYTGKASTSFDQPLLTPPYSQSNADSLRMYGTNLLANWKHDFTSRSSFNLRAYYDGTGRHSGTFSEHRNTFDVDAQHNFTWGDRHRIVWGAGYRVTHDDIMNTPIVQFSPSARTINLASGFLQDEIALIPNRLAFIVGTKIEHNDLTGFVVQPNGRLRWTPTESLTFWSAISRGIRTPSRAEDDGRATAQTIPPNTTQNPGPLPALVSLFGNRGFTNEALTAYELGGRAQLHSTLSVDVAAFYNKYDHLLSLEPGTPTPELSPAPPHLVVPFSVGNKLRATTQGVEVSLDWHPLEWWRLQTSYTYLTMSMGQTDSLDSTRNQTPGRDPRHLVSIRSLMKLPGNIEFDLWGRYVDTLSSLNIPSYVSLDTRVAWRPTPKWELAVVGQNLLDAQHPEFSTALIPQARSEIQRGAYVKATWRY